MNQQETTSEWLARKKAALGRLQGSYRVPGTSLDKVAINRPAEDQVTNEIIFMPIGVVIKALFLKLWISQIFFAWFQISSGESTCARAWGENGNNGRDDWEEVYCSSSSECRRQFLRRDKKERSLRQKEPMKVWGQQRRQKRIQDPILGRRRLLLHE